jgi:hypothetical protein
VGGWGAGGCLGGWVLVRQQILWQKVVWGVWGFQGAVWGLVRVRAVGVSQCPALINALTQPFKWLPNEP